VADDHADHADHAGDEGRHVAADADGRHVAADPDGRHVAAEPEAQQGPLGMVTAAVREVVVVVVMALVLSFVVKTWLLQAFFIPSGSMEDTLLVGDRVIVSKLTPGPVDLKHGDVVVFQDPGGWLEVAPPVERSGISGAVHDGLVFVGLLPAES
jgi:signal peptidase I